MLLDTCVSSASEEPQVIESGGVVVDSSASDDFSVVRVRPDAKRTEGLLLEMATVFTGLGLTIKEASTDAGGWVRREGHRSRKL